jgi:hypothetical protein
MPPGPPEKKLRWERVIFALLLLAGLITGAVMLIIR